MAIGCDHPHASPQGLQSDHLVQAMRTIEAEILSRGEKLTAPRRRVLEMILEAGAPVKAYDLIARFHTDGQSAKPPTVYRALSFLETMGLVHRIESLNAFVACTLSGAPHVAAFLICTCCNTTLELASPATQTLIETAKANGHRVEHVNIELRGLCAKCAAPESAASA